MVTTIAVCYALVAIVAMVIFYIVVSIGKMWSTVTPGDKAMCVIAGAFWPCFVVGFVCATVFDAIFGSKQ